MMAGSTGRFTTGRIYDCIRIRSPRRSCSFLLTSGRSPYNPIYLFAPHAANRSPTSARPVSRRTVCEVTTVWLGRSDWSRRDTRQREKTARERPIGGGGDSPVMHRAPVIDVIVHSRADQISRRRHRQYTRGRAVFPRRRTGAKSPPHRCRFASCAGEPTPQRCRKTLSRSLPA
jgi:hypothetical protein